MKILVLVKETITTNARMSLDRDGHIVSSEETYIINPFDEFAIEEAIRIKERYGGEVVLLTVGRREASYMVRSGLAMGCDRGVLLVTSDSENDAVCDILKDAILQEQDYDMILAGWVSSDYNNAQVTGRLSEALNIPLVTLVTSLDIKLDLGTVVSEREGDVYLEIVETKLPCMIAVQKGINQPRFPRLIDIVEVKNKKIDVHTCTNKSNIKMTTPVYSLPPKKKHQVLVDGSDPEKAVQHLFQELKGAKLL